MINFLIWTAIAALTVSSAFGQNCRLRRAFDQPNRNAPARSTPVWSDAESSALFFAESLNVNTDGTRRSYSVDDFWGQRVALNNLCNAMSDECAGLDSEGKRKRRLLTQRAFASDWPANLLRLTKISPDIIPFKNHKPCPLVDGYLVSATALQRPRITDVCDITNYVDALAVAAIVIPKGHATGFARRGAKVGDLAVVMLPGSRSPVFAVVGDEGPVNKLGEGSVALNGKLLGKTAAPVNYDEVKGRGRFAGPDWNVPRALVLIFPATRDRADPYMSQQRIDAAARRRFEAWGGVGRLNACGREYARR